MSPALMEYLLLAVNVSSDDLRVQFRQLWPDGGEPDERLLKIASRATFANGVIESVKEYDREMKRIHHHDFGADRGES